MSHHPTFFKELPLIVQIQGKPEWVGFSCGFAKRVDPLSGMTINLKYILNWQNEWRQLSSLQSFASWPQYLSEARAFFWSRANSIFSEVSEGIEGCEVQVRFFDSSELRLISGGDSDSAGKFEDDSRNLKDDSSRSLQDNPTNTSWAQQSVFVYVKRAPVVDRERALRIIHLHFRLSASEPSELIEKCRNFALPVEIPESFNDPKRLRTFLESGWRESPIEKIEIQDSETLTSVFC